MITAARELSLNMISILTGSRRLQNIERRVNKGLRRYMGDETQTLSAGQLRPLLRRIDLGRRVLQG